MDQISDFMVSRSWVRVGAGVYGFRLGRSGVLLYILCFKYGSIPDRKQV